MVEARSQVVMNLTTTFGINEVLLRMGMVLSFLGISLCVGVGRRMVVGILSIQKTFIVLISKAQLFFACLSLIPT